MDKENQFFDENSTPRSNALKAHSMLDTIEKDNGENRSGSVSLKSPQEIMDNLTNGLKIANAEIGRLKAKLNEYEIDKGETDIVNQRNELLKLLSQRDNTIERKSMEITMLEKQLEAAVSAKFDALARLDAVGGKGLTELSHSLTNNRTEMMGDKCSKRRRKQNNTQNQEWLSQQKLQDNSDNAVDECSDAASIQNELLCDVPTRRRKQNNTLDREWLSQQKLQDNSDNAVDECSDAASIQNELVCDVPTRRRKQNNTLDREWLSQQKLQDNSDNAMDECSDAANIQNELLSEVRTRRQNRFILDAFGGIGSSQPNENVNEDPSAKNDKMVGGKKLPKSSHRSPFVKLTKITFTDK